MQDVAAVDRVNVSPSRATAASRIRPFVSARSRIIQQSNGESSVVLWTAVSPRPAGHFRDRLFVLPALAGLDTIAVVHWGDFDSLFSNKLTRHSAKRLVRSVRGFVFLDESLSEKCAAWIPEAQRYVVPNTIDEDILCSADEVEKARAARRSSQPFRLLFVGNMITSKGYLDVLRSISILAKDGSVAVDFVGRWYRKDERQAFEQEVARLELTSLVRHHGPITERGIIKKMLLSAHVLALPTYYAAEAQPIVILEAINAGTPIVTTRHAGIPLMTGSDAAVFVGARNPTAVANAVRTLMETARWDEISRAARQRFEKSFSPDHVRSRWVEVVSRVAH